MRSECLPFTAIPHTSALFTDLLYHFDRVARFYPRSADLKDWAKEQAQTIAVPPGRRNRVAAILDRQNSAWDAPAETNRNIARLAAGAACVVTGQQVGLFGGPLFAIFKALSAIRLAEQATACGVDCVPVFWLATEDHDLAEVNHATLLADGSLHGVSTSSHGAPDAPISAVRLGQEIREAVAAVRNLLGDSEAADLLAAAYQPGETLGSAFARLFAQLVGRWGVIMLDASDPQLHTEAMPVYRAAMERAAELDQALLERGRELTAAGYHEQVKITERSTLLFTLQNGARVVIHRANGMSGGFRVGQEKIAGASELAQRIESEPQHFSPNVLLRPVVQDYLLPTLTYTGGPAECAYFAQAAVVYEKLLGRTTPVVPRFSATLVEPKPAGLLDRYGLKLTDLFHGPEALREVLAARVLPSDLQNAFESSRKALHTSLAQVEDALGRLDSTLVDAARRAGSKMQYQLARLEGRAARAQLLRGEVLERHAAQLSASLYPHKSLQEREIAGISFVARHGRELLEGLYEAAGTGCPDHQVLYL